MPATSCPVATALTPGNASAALTSIRLIRPYAIGLRNTLPHSIPGRVMSTAYTTLPLTFSTLSTRGTEVPMAFVLFMRSLGLDVFDLVGSCHFSPFDARPQPQQTRHQGNAGGQ